MDMTKTHTFPWNTNLIGLNFYVLLYTPLIMIRHVFEFFFILNFNYFIRKVKQIHYNSKT